MYDIVNPLFKNHGGGVGGGWGWGDRRPNVTAFVVWSALIVGG